MTKKKISELRLISYAIIGASTIAESDKFDKEMREDAEKDIITLKEKQKKLISKLTM